VGWELYPQPHALFNLRTQPLFLLYLIKNRISAVPSDIKNATILATHLFAG